MRANHGSSDLDLKFVFFAGCEPPRRRTSFDTVKTRIQCAPPGTYSGAFDVLFKIVRHEVKSAPRSEDYKEYE